MSEVPPVIVNFNSELTDEHLAELKKRWEAATAGPQRYRWLYKGRWRRALPLPWHTRLRLWCTSRIDSAGYWLVRHGRFGAARRLWRL